MRSRRAGEIARRMVARAATALAVLVVVGVGGDARAQTGGDLLIFVCNPVCGNTSNSGGGVLTATLTLPGPEIGNSAGTDIEVLPAEFSQSGDPEISFISFAQTISTTADIVSTIGYVVFDQDHMVETLVLTNTTSAVIDYDLDVLLQVTGDAANLSYAELATEWYMTALGQQDGVSLDSGVTRVEIDSQGEIVINSSGHHDRDLSIVDMGSGMYRLFGSGNITATGIPINSTTRFGIDIFPSAHQTTNSFNALCQTEGNNGPGLRYTLRPLDTLVTITAIPVSEPGMPGFAALIALAALARVRRSTRA